MISEDKAKVKSKILAYHRIKGAEGGESWCLRGWYEHGLKKDPETKKWVIDRMQLNVEEQFGNTGLLI